MKKFSSIVIWFVFPLIVVVMVVLEMPTHNSTTEIILLFIIVMLADVGVELDKIKQRIGNP